jgi:hypothetical protein
MLYVGLPMNIGETLRLLKLDEKYVPSFYDTKPIGDYLKQRGSELLFEYLDKGICLLAIQVRYPRKAENDVPNGTVDQTIVDLIDAKQRFFEECHKLTIDLRCVEIQWIESEPFVLENPQPYVIPL